MDPPSILSFQSSSNDKKFKDIAECFKLKYDKSPKFYVRFPGRINLIGEHIDYCGFSVLPMAIEQDMVLAVAFNKNRMLNLSNFDSDMYEDFSISLKDFKFEVTSPRWYHYVLSGIKGVIENYNFISKGLDVVVKGIIPPSSGLSSSSALVSAAALAMSFANGIFLPKMDLSSLCARSERYVGTEGGGMDQAIGFLAEEGCAKHIEFNPLRATSISLPKNVAFVVSNCGVEMNKVATSHFNTRVVECRLAAKMLAKAYQLDICDVRTLGDVLSKIGLHLPEMPTIVKKVLHIDPYTKSEICEILEINDATFRSFLNNNTLDLKVFKLHQRALHVYEEAHRVIKFRQLCEESNDCIEELGQLMNGSHASCRDLYECSHPCLDELVETAIKAGAIGSRLTGAGWGGCCISLVNEYHAEDFINQIKQNFYQVNDDRKKVLKCGGVFITKPSKGAAVYTE